MVPNLAGNSERSDLVRGLALWSATAMSSAMPPARDFSCTSEMARAVGSATCFRGMDHRWIRVHLGAVCHAELGAAFPKAGGPTSISAGVSALCGDFSLARMSSLLERPVGMATLATGFVRFLGFLFPSVATPLVTTRLGGSEFTLQQGPTLAALMVVVVTAMNYFSVRMSGAI